MVSDSQPAPTIAQIDLFVGGGEMGELMRSIDWSQTPLGPIAAWPQSLRTSLSICLASRFPILIWWGPELVMLYNDAYRPMLGASKHPQAMGQRGQECWPEIWDVIGPMLMGVLNEGKATWSNDQLLLLHRNGYTEECYFTFSYSPIRDETGGIGGVFTAVTETTQRVLGERRLRTLSELAAQSTEAHSAEDVCRLALKTLEKNPNDLPYSMLYLLNVQGTQARLVGCTGLAIDTPASPLMVDLTDQESNATSCLLAAVATSGNATPVDGIAERYGSWLPSVDGEPIRSALILPIARPGQEGLYGFLITGVSPRRALDDNYRNFFDLITGQVAANIASVLAYQEELTRAEALAALDLAKTTFFSNVSHEFRTPLTLLLGPIEDALADDIHPLAPAQRERLEMVQRNGLRLLKLVNTLLDFSRIEAGRMQALFEPVDLATFTSELASTFRSVIERAGMTLVVDCPPLPESIYIDREMWEKIVLNLLSNAFKFTFEGQIMVALRLVEQAVELEVHDTGVGITEEELPLIFERFHSGTHLGKTNTRARTFEGSGIGLALVQELVHLHGGIIRVSSTVGKGTTFTVSLPRGAAHLPADRISPSRALASTPLGAAPYVEEALRWLPDAPETAATGASAWIEQPSPPSFASPPVTKLDRQRSVARLLVVDDNADMREYITHLLSPFYAIEALPEGLAALRAIKQQPPDLVISDVMMPGLDGFQLLQAIRRDPRTRLLPVILLSARAGEESTVEGLQAGADDYLVKPFSSRELLARVETRLEMTQLRLDLAQQAQDHARRLQQLADAALVINTLPPPEELLQFVTLQARQLIGAQQAFVGLTDLPDGTPPLYVSSLADTYAAWQETQAQEWFSWPARSMLAAQVCRTNLSVRITQAELEAPGIQNPLIGEWKAVEQEARGQLPLRGWLAAPLVGRDGHNLGLLALSEKEEGEFTVEDEAILVQLAQLASIALENTWLYQQVRQALRTRDELFSLVTHDLKNPLGAIKGYAQLAHKQLTKGQATELANTAGLLTRIDALSSRMTAQINELLDLAHLQTTESLKLTRREVDLVALARQVVAEYQQTTSHHIAFNTQEERLPGLVDAVRLERILANLLSNAIKYSPKDGQIEIHLEKREEQGRACAIIRVRDAGIGIPAADIPRIFEPFHRASNVTGKIPGTGLGLSSVAQMVQQHGGTISVESQEHQGSTFTVHLPLEMDTPLQ